MYTNNGEPRFLHINLPHQNLPDKWELGFGSAKPGQVLLIHIYLLFMEGANNTESRSTQFFVKNFEQIFRGE